VIDCETGGLLAMCSMPSYDPNRFSDGISKSEWAMLSSDDHLPLMNKVLLGLYPPGSTVKPMNSLALLRWGVDPEETVNCPGFFRLGNATFHCWRPHGHGPINMHRAIQQSCDVYFYTMVRRIGIDKVAGMAHELGLGEKFDLPAVLQRYGTFPDSAWKLRKYKKAWTTADTINASIGQGYVLVNPLQLAVMAARIASGKALEPRLIGNKRYGPQGGPLNLTAEQLAVVHGGMRDVINTGGAGTAGASKLPVPGVEMAGKTGTAQVRRITAADRAAGRASAIGMSGAWKLRDHAHFIAFAPVEQPRYAIGVTLEHGGHGPAAGVIARDVMTFLFAPDKAMDTLAAFERQWGGDIATRMAAETARWQAAQSGQAAAPAPDTPQEAADQDQAD
jgi:penicillin-binding protein 2